MDPAACAENHGPPNRLHPDQGINAIADPSGHACHNTNRSASFKRRVRCELASRTGSRVFRAPARPAAMIRIDSIWLATEPLDMRAGTETALARVVAVFGAAKPALICLPIVAPRA
jgi:hypothetical protein